MTEHPNVEIVRKAYEEFAAGNVGALASIFADDVVWHIPGRSSVSGEHRGRDAVFAAFAKLAELSGGTFRIDVHDIVGNGTHVVGLQRNTASREDKTLDVNVAQVAHLSEGKIVEMWAHVFDVHALDEFWS